MIAKDFVSSDCRVIEENEHISRALSLFEETDSIIVTRKKEYAGMLVEKELTRAKLPPNAKVKSFVRPAPKINPDTPIGEVARLMLENEAFILPVFEDKKLIGVVKVDDLLKKIVEKELGYEKIGKFVSKDVKFVSPGDNIGKVIKIFRENNISRLPVVEDGKVVGVITMHDLMEKGMIVSSDGKLMGIVTKKDLLEPIASTEKEEKIFVQFCGELDRVEDFDRSEGMTLLNNFLRKHETFLETGYLYVYLKQHKERKHGIPLVYCKLRLSCPKGVFTAADNGWGFHAALKNAVSAMEKQIEKAKGK